MADNSSPTSSSATNDLVSASPSSDGESALPSTAALGRLRDHVLDTVAHHVPASDDEAASMNEPPKRTGSYAHWLPVLRALPWVLGALFALSFA